MEFLYYIFVIGCGIATVTNGQNCDTAAVAGCASAGNPNCQTLPTFEQCVMQFADVCGQDSIFVSFMTSIQNVKSMCAGGGGNCDIMALSACSSTDQSPTCESIAATEMCMGKFASTCASNPAFMGMSNMIMAAKQNLNCQSTGNTGNNGGSAGGNGGTNCNMTAMGICQRIIQDKFGSGQIEFTPKLIKPACSTFLKYQTCSKSTGCEGNIMVKQMIPMIEQICKPGGCKVAEIMACLTPLQRFKKIADTGIPQLNTAALGGLCSNVKLATDCIEKGDLLTGCEENSLVTNMKSSILMLGEIHQYLCVDKMDVIKENKDCFDKKEVIDAGDMCYIEHLMSDFKNASDPNTRPTDSVLCSSLNSNNDCIKGKLDGLCGDRQITLFNRLTKEGMVKFHDIKSCPLGMDDTGGSASVMATTFTVFIAGIVALFLS